jgi:manganese oxidase
MSNQPVFTALALLILAGSVSARSGEARVPEVLPEILANTNRKPAGQLRNGVLTIKLEARTGSWYPETKDGPSLTVQAFAEEGHALQIPAPLVRVSEGTEIRAIIRNSISGATLVMHGFHTRPGEAKDSLEVPSGQAREVRFKAGAAGTYFYWASAGGPLVDGRPCYADSLLSGAFIVDPRGQNAPADERIFVIGQWLEPVDNFKPDDPDFKREVVTINGTAWPYTERLIYSVGQAVRWRWINPAPFGHPMHLHGFFYQVNSKGDAERDSIYKQEEQRRVVTERMPANSTMSVTWVAERAGNWLFHCHILAHISPELRLRPKPASDQHSHDPGSHAREGMAGLVLGIQVLQSSRSAKTANVVSNRRSLTLIAQEQPGRFGKDPGLGFVLQDGNTEPPPNKINIPGPTIVLTRGEPVAIKVVNKLREGTSIHWHGIELESYYDGVAGWGSGGGSVSPMIEPGQSFVAEITPPRSGTFIYHTHMHNQQLGSGMYGPLIVVEPGRKFDPATDKILLMSVGGPDDDSPSFLDGSNKPEPMQLRVGVKYRLRIINITANNQGPSISLLSGDSPVKWRAIAKDGLDLPPSQAVVKPAHQPVTVGETHDFEFQPKEAGDLRFEVRDGEGKVVVQMAVQVH